MSSESFDRSDARQFLWNDGLERERYAVAEYYVETAVDPEAAAIALAKEQSATASTHPGTSQPAELAAHTARVVSVEDCGETEDPLLPAYTLSTEVYAAERARRTGCSCAILRIGYPIANFGHSLTNLVNAAGAEVHRLGFMTAMRLVDIALPGELLTPLPGPRYGVSGLRRQWGVEGRPLLCRSTRPAVGLDTDAMVAIAEQVLGGGFDGIKDDELTCDTPRSPFTERVRRMVEVKRRVQERTGERKFYIANVIDDPARALELAEQATEAGADGLLVAPSIQGLFIAELLRPRTDLAIFAHNSWMDALCRHPRFGVARALLIKLQRLSGADIAVLPGDFATAAMDRAETAACLEACSGELGSLARTLPVIMGGKSPQGLRQYRELISGNDFMIIAATTVDTHPGGLAEGARAFRDAWDGLAAEAAESADADLEQG